MNQRHIITSTSATPINALNAVAVDCETTGLDLKTARLIQIGAIRIASGEMDHSGYFDELVDPGESIPDSSTAIHGIRTEDVAGAATFADTKDRFEAWTEKAIVIGYAIGFDLAILKKESELANLPWNPPRTIDVRHMVNILSPNLPEYSLDSIAGWLGIEVVNRHQALADAILAGEVFLKLLPMIRKTGIRTLAELESACRNSSSRDAVSEAQAGWYDFIHSDKEEDSTRRVYARIDSYPYRHRVSDIMSTPVQQVSHRTRVSEALALMVKNRISCVFVDRSEQHSGTDKFGMLTERDILRALDRHGAACMDHTAGEYASFPLVTVPEDAFLYRAMGRMSRNSLRHLGVLDGEGTLSGVLTSRDLLKQRADDAMNLGDAIDFAETDIDLGMVWANLAAVATALDHEEVDARDIAAVISRELRALTRRCCEIAEKELEQQGDGHPPVPYAMMVLGSGGRGESLMAMDQDNAIIFESGKAGGPEDIWFEKLGSRVSELLDNTGVPYCKGNIMASNALWRMSVQGWKSQIGNWISRTSPEDLLKTDIFFDAVAVHGERRLMQDLYDHALELGSSSRNFLHMLSANAADIQSPLGMLGRFKLHEGRMDIKMGGLLPIFSAARVQAIRHRIQDRSTPSRLQAAAEHHSGPENLPENLEEAHRIILTAILKQQIYDLENGLPLSNKVAPDKMKSAARSNLRWALEQVPSVTDLLDVPL